MYSLYAKNKKYYSLLNGGDVRYNKKMIKLLFRKSLKNDDHTKYLETKTSMNQSIKEYMDINSWCKKKEKKELKEEKQLKEGKEFFDIVIKYYRELIMEKYKNYSNVELAKRLVHLLNFDHKRTYDNVCVQYIDTKVKGIFAEIEKYILETLDNQLLDFYADASLSQSRKNDLSNIYNIIKSINNTKIDDMKKKYKDEIELSNKQSEFHTMLSQKKQERIKATCDEFKKNKDMENSQLSKDIEKKISEIEEIEEIRKNDNNLTRENEAEIRSLKNEIFRFKNKVQSNNEKINDCYQQDI